VLGGLKIQEGQVEVPPGFDDMLQEIAVFKDQLRLWFEDTSEIVRAFDDFVNTAALTSSLREAFAGSTPPPSMSAKEYESLRQHFAQHSGDVTARRKRYLDAARQQLRSGSL
jgi:hypothetical protein